MVLLIQRTGLPNADASPMRRALQDLAVGGGKALTSCRPSCRIPPLVECVGPAIERRGRGGRAMKCQRCPKQATSAHHRGARGGPVRGGPPVRGLRQEVPLRAAAEEARREGRRPWTRAESRRGRPGRDPRARRAGITFLEFRNHGRFGCPHDYDAFKADLLPLLESVHGDVRHAGKTPRRLRGPRPHRPNSPSSASGSSSS